ncbi:tetratricopeptide repeat protein [Acidicapsa acidisoli]|uniref:tetratricopeptide repeat protein n=1 Tax=Acidicapsa acidisoli TaxID=1615681 RepID=UPI0021DF5E30|nr:tetratricopeptide repeat protein [Acidicapsa acidisoli]
MEISLRSIATVLFTALCFASASRAQVEDAISSSSTLQEHYEHAGKQLAANNPEEAAKEYRLFLADALGELAVGIAHAGQYKEAVPYFDEALSFASDSATLNLDYAHAALQSGDIEHASILVERAALDSPQSKAFEAKVHILRGRILVKKNSNEQARRELEEAVALDPTFEAGYELAVTCLNMEDKQCAAKIFSEMSASFGDSAQLHMYYGRAYENSDFQTEAVTEFQKTIVMDSHLAGAHYSLAAAYLAIGGNEKLTRAIDELMREIRLFPKNAMAYAALGHLEADQHKLTEAEKNLNRAAALDARNPDTFLYLGQIYAEMGKTVEAEGALRASIQLTTDPSRNRYQVQKAHYLLGRLLVQSGDAAEGKKELAASEALLNANLSRDRDRLSDYLEENSGMGAQSRLPSGTQALVVPKLSEADADPEAQRQVDEFKRQIGPAVADSYNNLGAIEASEKDFPMALRYFEHAAEWNPEMEGLDLNWGRSAYSAGEFKEAIAPLTRYLRTHPDDKNMRSELGLSDFIQRDYTNTLATLEVIEADPGIAPQVAYAYAESLVETGQVRVGVERLKSLESRVPGAAAVHRALGEALAANGDTKSGVQELETAIQLNPQSAESYNDLGKLQLNQGNTTAAIVSLEKAVSLAPQDGVFHRNLADAYRKASRAAEADREMQLYKTLPRADIHQAP